MIGALLSYFIITVHASTYGSNILINGSPTAVSTYTGYPIEQAFDSNDATKWNSDNTSRPMWVRFTDGNNHYLDKIDLVQDQREKDFTITGTNNSDYTTASTTLFIGTFTDNNGTKDTQTFFGTSTAQYKYFQLNLISRYDGGNWADIYSWNGYECLDCRTGTSTISTGMISDNLLQLLYYILEALIVGSFAYLTYKIFFKR